MITIGLISDFHEESKLTPFLEKLCDNQEFHLESVDRFRGIESIAQAVWGLINLSDVIVADFCRSSANLSYEVGLAHGLGKPVILVVEERADIPPDLLGQRVLSVSGKSSHKENFLFRLRTAIEDSQRRGESFSGYRGPKESKADWDFKENHFSPSRDFRSLFAFEGPARGRRFEEWFSEVSRGVPGWEVIEPDRGLRASRNREFDLVLWNSIDDYELNAFGNPIAVEFKAARSMNSKMLHEFLHRSKNSGLKAVILATTGLNDRSTKRRLARFRQEEGINAIALDRDDFLQVSTPKDLIYIVKDKVRSLLYEEGV